MLRKSIYFPLQQLQVLVPCVLMLLYVVMAMRLKFPAYLVLMTIPVVGRAINYFLKKYYASMPDPVERVGDELIIRGVFSRVDVDINIINGLHVANKYFSRALGIKLLVLQTIDHGQIRIWITEETVEKLAIIMPGVYT